MITAMVALLLTGKLSPRLGWTLHANSFVNQLAVYQLLTLVMGVLVTVFVLWLYPESRQFLRIGDLKTLALKEKWLGVSGTSSWMSNGLQLLFFISLATGIFMFLGLQQTNALHNFRAWFIPFILLFSLSNSLTEELIFRFAVMGGLGTAYSKLTILLVSAILFGLPHYFGNPSGVIGVLMAGLLGYILCKASLETKGLAIAWLIHFVQDLIIFTALLMMKA